MELLTNYVKNIIITFTETKPYLIIIDELDDILAPHGRQFENIAALINEIKELNAYFYYNNILVKIIVLCRTDMFEKLPGQNLNKIKQSNSFTFTWYREGIDSNKHSDLVNLINKRAKLTYPVINDVFKEFFPQKYNNINIYSALLDYTRHTPRDFIQLINYIQQNCDSENVTKTAITKGIKNYSTDYFLPEISNELSGYLPSVAIQPVFNVISSIRSQSFTYEQFIKIYNDVYALKDIDPLYVLNILYDWILFQIVCLGNK